MGGFSGSNCWGRRRCTQEEFLGVYTAAYHPKLIEGFLLLRWSRCQYQSLEQWILFRTLPQNLPCYNLVLRSNFDITLKYIIWHLTNLEMWFNILNSCEGLGARNCQLHTIANVYPARMHRGKVIGLSVCHCHENHQILTSRHLSSSKCNQSVEIGDKLVWMCFESFGTVHARHK